MAKPIEIGLVLEGQDAVDLQEYLNNPAPVMRRSAAQVPLRALPVRVLL